MNGPAALFSVLIVLEFVIGIVSPLNNMFAADRTGMEGSTQVLCYTACASAEPLRLPVFQSFWTILRLSLSVHSPNTPLLLKICIIKGPPKGRPVPIHRIWDASSSFLEDSEGFEPIGAYH